MSETSISRRQFVSAATVLGAITYLSLNQRSYATSLIPFKVGMSAPANTFLAIWMADIAGFYKAYGLDLTVLKMAGGKDAGPALQSGRIQAMHIGMSSVIRADAAGADLRVIGSLSNVVRFTLFTAPGVKTAEQLKGGIIGISSFGSESDAILTLALQKLGLTRQDVTVKEVGVDPERVAALEAGTIRATMLNEPARSHALELGLNPIVDLLADHVPWIFTGIVADNAYITAHREILIQFLKATIEGNYLALTDEDRAKQVLARELKLSNPKIVDISYTDFKQQTPLDLEVSRAGAENVIAQVATGNASHRVDDYVDTSLLEQIRQEGFFDEVKKKYKMT
jgi:NitT/TauT family transport system substrate-binding protein